MENLTEFTAQAMLVKNKPFLRPFDQGPANVQPLLTWWKNAKLYLYGRSTGGCELVNKKLSRFEVNKKVRRALVKNGADMSQLSFSCTGRSVNLTGSLLKEGGMEFSAMSLEQMLGDIHKVGVQVVSDLENWDICDGSISRKGGKSEEDENEDESESSAS